MVLSFIASLFGYDEHEHRSVLGDELPVHMNRPKGGRASVTYRWYSRLSLCLPVAVVVSRAPYSPSEIFMSGLDWRIILGANEGAGYVTARCDWWNVLLVHRLPADFRTPTRNHSIPDWCQIFPSCPLSSRETKHSPPRLLGHSLLHLTPFSLLNTAHSQLPPSLSPPHPHPPTQQWPTSNSHRTLPRRLPTRGAAGFRQWQRLPTAASSAQRPSRSNP